MVACIQDKDRQHEQLQKQGNAADVLLTFWGSSCYPLTVGTAGNKLL